MDGWGGGAAVAMGLLMQPLQRPSRPHVICNPTPRLSAASRFGQSLQQTNESDTLGFFHSFPQCYLMFRG